MLSHIGKYILLLTLIAGFTLACQTSPTPNKNTSKPSPSSQFNKCTEPRPQMCTREYRPVCATKDTGIRCVTTPCLSTENKTYPTACVACSDPKVIGYTANACK